MAKYILFDIDDTLFPSTEFSSLARKNALNAMISMGLDIEYDDLNTRLTKIIESKGSNYEKHFDDLCRQVGVKDSGRYIAAAVAAYHDTKTAIAPFPKVPFTLLKLRQLGYHLYIATRGNSIKQWDKLIRLRIHLYFDGVFVSDGADGGKGKLFYLKILKKLDASPQDCIMVGDREDTDILPASDAGMITVRVLTGKYAAVSTKTSKANFVIKDLGEILDILNISKKL